MYCKILARNSQIQPKGPLFYILFGLQVHIFQIFRFLSVSSHKATGAAFSSQDGPIGSDGALAARFSPIWLHVGNGPGRWVFRVWASNALYPILPG